MNQFLQDILVRTYKILKDDQNMIKKLPNHKIILKHFIEINNRN
jgi:hypothetical protein